MCQRYEEIDTQNYYDRCHMGNDHVDYKDSCGTKGFLQKIAGQLQESFQPKNVLVVGCAMESLAEDFRDLGVPAYEINASKCTDSKVQVDIRPCCKSVSVSEELPERVPQHFDLVAAIAAAEHPSEKDSDCFFDCVCSRGDRVAFFFTDEGYGEAAHANVQKIEYWAKKFAQRGFYRDFSCDLGYLSKSIVCFVKYEEPSPVLLSEGYERILRTAADEKAELIQQLESGMRERKTLKNTLEQRQKEKSAEMARLEEKNKENVKKLMKARQELDLANHALQKIQRSVFWKMSKPLRVLVNLIKKGMKKFKITRLVYKGLASIKDMGIRGTYRRLRKRVTRRNEARVYLQENVLTEKQRAIEEKTKFQNPVTFSVIVPVYNCPQQFLREMIDSVVGQTYPNWQLCLADGSDQAHSYVEEVCSEYAEKDSRIKYRKLKKNLGISANTNEAIDMASGEYITLFDHDDMLHPSALFQVMKVIEEQHADFIYTDECSFEGTLANPTFIHFKPDYAPDTLRSNNYICHLSTFSRELMNQVGRFSAEHDGSQDYDMILRLTEKAKRIVHIPRVLYYWRVHSGSVASGVDVKPYCLTAGKKALQNHLERIGLKGQVTDSKVPSTYKIDYEIEKTPLISILIPNKDHSDDLKKCIHSILDRSTYKNIEIVVVENNSTESKTFAYYEELEKNPIVKVVTWKEAFNYSAINNYGAGFCSGEYLLLLNNDVEVITPNWIEEMLMFAQRKDVGAVGARLLYPDGTLQHGGIILGLGGIAGHAQFGIDREDPGYASRISFAQDLSACTAACLLVRKELFDQIDGFDEGLAVAFNDVDFCLRIREKGYLIICTPYAELYHYESKSRGYEDTPEKQQRFQEEIALMKARWGDALEHDPYYNPNLTLEIGGFTLKD